MKKPKILVFDIETFPNIVYTWPGMFEVNVIKIIKEGEMASFAYKWLGEKQVTCHTREKQKNDKQLIQKLRSLFNEADVIVAHNGDKFDIKTSNSRFLKYKLQPPPSHKTIDTLKVAKRYFKLNSYSLDNIAKFLGLGQKKKTGGFQLWDDCMKDRRDAWREMKRYNKQDVVLLEKVYLELRPWIKNHPYSAVDVNGCPKCGSSKLHRRGTVLAGQTTYQRLQCQGCGGWCRSSKKVKTSPKLGVKNL